MMRHAIIRTHFLLVILVILWSKPAESIYISHVEIYPKPARAGKLFFIGIEGRNPVFVVCVDFFGKKDELL